MKTVEQNKSAPVQSEKAVRYLRAYLRHRPFKNWYSVNCETKFRDEIVNPIASSCATVSTLSFCLTGLFILGISPGCMPGPHAKSPNEGPLEIIMPPPLIGRGIKRCFCLTSDVCLSRTSGLSREHRGLGRLKLA